MFQGLAPRTVGTEAAPAEDALFFCHDVNGILPWTVLGKPFPPFLHRKRLNIRRTVSGGHCLIVDIDDLFQVAWLGVAYLHRREGGGGIGGEMILLKLSAWRHKEKHACFSRQRDPGLGKFARKVGDNPVHSAGKE